jgi:hypothetical protein
MKLRFPLFIAIVVVFGTIQSAATTCKSKPPKVKNASGVVLFHGTPLARVSVEVIREDGNGVPEASMVTGEDGRFLLPVREKGLHRLKVTWPKMHPAISSVVIVASREPLQVVLELVAPTEWRIPRCPPSTHGNSLGFDFRLTLPSSMKTEAKGCSVDACLFEIHFTEETGTTSTMWVTVGSAIGTDDDTPRVDGAATITERHLVSHGDRGIDSRGTLHNGRFWRDVTSWYGAARYTNASAETAAAFDRVIDATCYPDPEGD